MIGASAALAQRSAPGNATTADHELGQDKIQLLGLDIHNPVFVVSSLHRSTAPPLHRSTVHWPPPLHRPGSGILVRGHPIL